FASRSLERNTAIYGWTAGARQTVKTSARFLIGHNRRRLAHLTIQRLSKAVLDEALTNVFDGLSSASERLGNPMVGPVRTVRVGLQQNLSASNLLARPLQLLDHDHEFVTFLSRQPDDILLVHRKPPCSPHHPRFRRFPQPQFLAVTKH